MRWLGHLAVVLLSGCATTPTTTPLSVSAEEHVEAARASVPEGNGWSCFQAHVGRRPAVFPCDRTLGECESLRAEYLSHPNAAAARAGQCRATVRAFCTSMWNVPLEQYESSCHGDEITCRKTRSEAEEDRRYDRVTPCVVVP